MKIPDSVTCIGVHAFSGCNGLTSVNIPATVTILGDPGDNAFSGCSNLEQITVDAENPYYDSRENCNAVIETQSNTLISGCKNTVIPSSITSIGASAFSGCTALNNVNIPDTVTTISELAFENCTSLTNIRLPKVVTSIGYDAFKDCTSLTSMNIPEGVTRLTTLFSDCTSLKSITIPSSVTDIDPMMVSGCTNLEKITVSPENKVYDSRDNCNAIIRNYISNGAYLEFPSARFNPPPLGGQALAAFPSSRSCVKYSIRRCCRNGRI